MPATFAGTTVFEAKRMPRSLTRGLISAFDFERQVMFVKKMGGMGASPLYI